MKNILLIILFTVTLLSCKKERECVCTATVAGASAGTTTITIKDTKKNATEECDKGDAKATIFGFSTVTECELK
jgi:hypothetical protein